MRSWKLTTQKSAGRWAWLALVGALLAACAPPNTTQSPTAERTATLTRGTLTATVNATGNVKSEAEVRLAFQQTGIVADVLFSEGQPVKKGDVIARLDTTDLELALAQAQASLDQAKGALQQAEVAVDRHRAG